MKVVVLFVVIALITATSVLGTCPLSAGDNYIISAESMFGSRGALKGVDEWLEVEWATYLLALECGLSNIDGLVRFTRGVPTKELGIYYLKEYSRTSGVQAVLAICLAPGGCTTICTDDEQEADCVYEATTAPLPAFADCISDQSCDNACREGTCTTRGEVCTASAGEPMDFSAMDVCGEDCPPTPIQNCNGKLPAGMKQEQCRCCWCKQKMKRVENREWKCEGTCCAPGRNSCEADAESLVVLSSTGAVVATVAAAAIGIILVTLLVSVSVLRRRLGTMQRREQQQSIVMSASHFDVNASV